MRRILYLSASSGLIAEDELDAILSVSRRNNAELGVTGMLLYAEGAFFQALEGEDDAVAALYARIVEDRRHKGVIRMLDETISRRDFADWSMGFHRIAPDAPLPEAFIDLARAKPADIAPRDASDVVLALMRSYVDNTLTRAP